jgi:hypothetical protein
MSKDTISIIMKRHHHLIEGLLNRFNKRQSEPEVFPKLFNQFKWELEKHFFLEEKAIFTFINTDDQELYETSEKLLNEHRKILDTLNLLETDLISGKETDLDELKKRLIAHRDIEDDEFYPKLDIELDEQKKREIFNRISTPV